MQPVFHSVGIAWGRDPYLDTFNISKISSLDSCLQHPGMTGQEYAAVLNTDSSLMPNFMKLVMKPDYTVFQYLGIKQFQRLPGCG